MDEQDGARSLTKPHRRRKTSTANQENGKQASPIPQPANNDAESWKAYWKDQGQPWRTEPEIDVERKKYLDERRGSKPNFQKGLYPFKGIVLNRADIEWLLATHESGRGPVDWHDKSQRERKGLDLRGANLSQVDLSGLPLAHLYGGVPRDEWYAFTEGARKVHSFTEEQHAVIALLMAEADLTGIHMERANLIGTHLEGSHLCDAHLEDAYLCNTYLEEADLGFAHLREADLTWAHLDGADLTGAHLEETDLNNIILVKSGDQKGISPRLVDAHWDNTNLAVVNWSQVKMLGDEYGAWQASKPDGKKKNRLERLNDFQEAVRANRQLAIMLQGQGLNEDAARFAYRARQLQSIVLRRQNKFGQHFFSQFLDLLAGYGYRPLRSILIYLFVVFGFAVSYYQGWRYYHLEHITKHSLSFLGAIVFSITAFHGRGFFLGGDLGYDSLITILGAIEAVIGLLIELSFIATFTQRFFGK